MIRRTALRNTLALLAAAIPGEAARSLAAALNVDFFVGYWKETKPRRLYGSLEAWDLLTRASGDPLKPKKRGAVLTMFNTVSYASLAPHASTRATRLSGVQHVLYIVSGYGTVRSGGTSTDIRQGFGIIVPPGLEFTLANGGDNPLILYVVEEPVASGTRVSRRLVIKNDFDSPISTSARRLDARYWLFTRRDGLAVATGMDQIIFEPRTFVPPHVHLPEEEEVWIALDDVKIQIGKEQRLLPAGAAYKPPADSRTPHVTINDSRENRRMFWIMKHRIAEPEQGDEQGKKLPDNVI